MGDKKEFVGKNRLEDIFTWIKEWVTDIVSGKFDKSGGTVTGTVILSKTTDASGIEDKSPALIVGGTRTTAHMEFDANEILAKASGTTTAQLNLNTDGGIVAVGKTGGTGVFKVNGTDVMSAIDGKQAAITSTNKLAYSLLSGTPTIPSKTSQLTNDSGYLTEHQDISGKLNTSGGTVTGTLTLSRTTGASGTEDKKPALIVGGASTASHLEFDANDIMAKSNGTTPTNLRLNGWGGDVIIGTTNGTGKLTVNGTDVMATLDSKVQSFAGTALYLKLYRVQAQFSAGSADIPITVPDGYTLGDIALAVPENAGVYFIGVQAKAGEKVITIKASSSTYASKIYVNIIYCLYKS